MNKFGSSFGDVKVKFGDGISWDNHVDEVLAQAKDRPLSHAGWEHTNKDIFDRCRNYLNTDTDKDKYKILDCGCHIGRWVESFKKCGFDYTGVDQSAYALEIAKKSWPEEKFVNTFLWDMDFKEEYDVAICVAVLQHNTNEEKEVILPRIYDALKPGGLFCMCESTTPENTKTQQTYETWIDQFKRHGLIFKESWHKNAEGFDDHYIFMKEKS